LAQPHPNSSKHGNMNETGT